MNTSALTLMVLSMGTVTILTAYFFYRVLAAPHRPEPDSYSDDDDE
jgi:hypothetical protein